MKCNPRRTRRSVGFHLFCITLLSKHMIDAYLSSSCLVWFNSIRAVAHLGYMGPVRRASSGFGGACTDVEGRGDKFNRSFTGCFILVQPFSNMNIPENVCRVCHTNCVWRTLQESFQSHLLVLNPPEDLLHSHVDSVFTRQLSNIHFSAYPELSTSLEAACETLISVNLRMDL